MGSKTPSPGYPASQQFTVPQLAAFVAAASCETFTEAAQRLCLSQPSLSRNIRELEEALGEVLFDRSCKGVRLSGAGHKLLPAAHELLLTHKQAQTGMATWRQCRSAQFRAVGSTAVMPLILTPLLKSLRSEFGTAQLVVDSAPSEEVVRQVLGGRASLGVSASQVVHPELRHTAVLDAPLGLLAASCCPLPLRFDTLDEFFEVPLVRLSDQSPVTRLLQGMNVPFKAYFQSLICVPCVMTAFDMVEKSGMAMITSGIAASHPQAAGMRFIALPHLLPKAQVHVISRRDTPFDAPQERMREILCESLLEAAWHPSVRRMRRSDALVQNVVVPEPEPGVRT